MSKTRTVLVLALGGLLSGFTVAARQSAPQALLFPVEVGYRLTLTYESDHSVSCNVNAVSGDFVRCVAGEREDRFGPTRPVVEQWYNLRTARMIMRTFPR
jgi:hypothetical protein